MKIRLLGQANDSGIGTHYHRYTRALQSVSGLNTTLELLDFTDTDAVMRSAKQSAAGDINISFVCANLNGYFRGHNINWAVFESTRIPDNLFQVMNQHMLWLPTEWSRKIAMAQGIKPEQIAVVPEGVDTDLFHPYAIPQHEVFRFLTIGKYEQRKSIDETIDAFAQVYGDNPNMELVIKSDFFREPEVKYYQLLDKIASTGVNNIHLVWGYQSHEQLANLYRSADVFLMPTKAEGWGLPIIEAAATGLPIVTTFHSGQTEFLQHIRSSCVFVNYQLKSIDCPEYREFYPATDGDYGQWAVASVEDIAKSIERAYNNYAALKSQAVKNSDVIRTKFSWANSVTASLSTLKQWGML
jgi:glycosyltransferase involved in cell wall biosynthesis